MLFPIASVLQLAERALRTLSSRLGGNTRWLCAFADHAQAVQFTDAYFFLAYELRKYPESLNGLLCTMLRLQIEEINKHNCASSGL
jgi:hypothetical protein